MAKFKAACIQINTKDNMQKNLKEVSRLIEKAAKKGADLITLPENTPFMSMDRKKLFAENIEEKNHPAVLHFCELAKNLKKWILIGSIFVKAGKNKLYNRSILINDKGKISARYDKIHLYNVRLKNGEVYTERRNFKSGNNSVIAKTPWGNLGMTICYDLRFPHLYRELAKKGADFISVPAAFVKYTGKAHWHILLQARAIENGCYIFAPAQTGKHPGNRETYGHSLIINPWGEILKDAKRRKGFVIAEIDTDMIKQVRKSMPSLTHDKPFRLKRH